MSVEVARIHLPRTSQAMRLYVVGSLCALIVIPAVSVSFDYSLLHSFLATILLAICFYPTARYYSERDDGLPTMAILCAAYAVQFALPIFTHDATFELLGGVTEYLSSPEITASLLLTIAGVIALQLGYYASRRSRIRFKLPIARLPLDKSKALLYCLTVGMVVPAIFTFRGIIPAELQQPLSSLLTVVQNQVLVVIGILGWIVYARDDSRFYTIALYVLVVVAAMRGISAASLEETVVPIGVLFVVKWRYTNKVPLGPILATLALIIFLSPVKAGFRQDLAADEQGVSDQSALAKGSLWIEQATDYWLETFSGSRNYSEATFSAASRTDLVHQVAHIYSLTPEVIPFQYGATYSYFVVAFIPRAFWPDKPVTGSANSFYAVQYGITSEQGAEKTTFGVSLLGEAYINFGWVGVLFVMGLQGLIISILQHSFGQARSGAGGQAVFLAFFVFFLNGIGSSAEILFGNILQNLLFGYLLLLWAREKPVRSISPRLRFAFLKH